MDKTALGRFISELRNEKNLTQEQLAEKLNVSSKTISKWECGTSSPDLDTLCLIAEIFNVSLYELTIYKRIKNPFISKKDILKIINKSSIKKIIITKISVIFLSLLTLVAMIFGCIYTINNYNQVQVYDLVSEDKNFNIEGIFIVTNNTYSLSISKVVSTTDDNILYKVKNKQIEYTISYKEHIYDRNRIDFDKNITLNECLKEIRIHNLNKSLKENIKHFNINIIYTNSNNEKETISFKINLVKKYSNNKFF